MRQRPWQQKTLYGIVEIEDIKNCLLNKLINLCIGLLKINFDMRRGRFMFYIIDDECEAQMSSEINLTI